MGDEERIRRLVLEAMETGATPAEVCKDRPDLLPEVDRRWRRARSVQGEVEALFPPAAAPKPPLGHTPPAPPEIAGYDEIEFLGRGGMGIVYKARHRALGRTVAIKMLQPGALAGREEAEALRREASAVAALQHPSIVSVFGIGVIDGRPYFSMEFLEGGSLADRIAGVPQPPLQAAALSATLARAVQAAHDGGVVHRDLKPGNILFTADGSPKIADFSLAWCVSDDPAMTLGLVMGTPSFMSPEQALRRPSWREPPVDVYALGAILYDLLTGRAPFRADTLDETLRQVIDEDPAPPTRLNARVPRDLETICLKCLRKEPRRRYPSARALAEDLERFLRGEPIEARRVGPLERFGKWVKRSPMTAAAAVAAIAASTAVLGTMSWKASQRAAIERAVTEDLDEVVRLEQASEWRSARNTLERARTRIAAGARREHLVQRAAAIEGELDLVDRLGGLRFERAASHQVEFDNASAWRTYRDAFTRAGLLREGDAPETFAARVRGSPARTALVDAMDDWSICATREEDLEWLTAATRLADPDPVWRDRARTVAVWKDPEAIVRLGREAPVESGPVPLMLIVAGRLLAIDTGEAIALLRRIQAAHPEDFWTSFALGECLEDGDHPQAVGFYRAAIALRPEAAATYVNLANVLAGQGELPEAIDCMLRAASLDPDDPYVRYGAALLLNRAGRSEEAVEHASASVRIDPGNFLMHGLLGSTLMEIGRKPEAAACFRRALELAPEGEARRAYFTSALAACEAAVATAEAGQSPAADRRE